MSGFEQKPSPEVPLDLYVRPTQFASLSEGGTDAAASTATIYSMAVGDTFSGTLAMGDTADWIAISLVAGQSIDIAMTGIGGSAVADPYLQFFDGAGTYIGFNNNSGPGNDALFSYTAPVTGTYYISAEEFNFDRGDYQVTVSAAAGLPVFTLDEIAFQLTDEYWTNQGDLRAGFNAGPGDTITVNITALTAAGQQLARWALEAWTDISGLIFQEVAGAAQITFDDEASGAYASSSLSGGYISSSTVNVSKTNWLPVYGTELGSYSFQTYMHEIGHALGLGHAGHYNGSASFGTDNHYLNDSWQATVMSYFDQVENTFITASKAYLVTMMAADIVAIQDLYGSAVSNNAGNTTYFANSNVTGYLGDLFGQITGEDPANPSLYDGAPIALTIFDTGGIDTLDFSFTATGNRIDLTPEAQSDVNGLIGNMTIARDTVIENVIGGSGNDSITGNAADNLLIGGAGADTLDGGSGSDTVSYAGASAPVYVWLDGSTNAGGAAGDVIIGVENLTGGGGADILVGDTGANVLDGGAGNDTIYARGGDDHVIGGAGNDTMYGQGGNDTLDGGSGSDTVSYAGASAPVYVWLDGSTNAGGAAGDVIIGVENLTGGGGADILVGDTGANVLDGGAGNDTIYARGGDDHVIGGAGNDTMYGQGGNDTLDGGSGSDTVSYAGASAPVYVWLDGSTNAGGAAGDVIIGVENLTGGGGADILVGDTGANVLDGGAGNDTIYARGGDDHVIGGAGNDTMYGQGGNDTFVFATGFGNDTIRFFEATNDLEKIDLSAVSAITNWADLTNPGNPHMTQVGTDVVINDFVGNTITLEGVNLADLHEADFIF